MLGTGIAFETTAGRRESVALRGAPRVVEEGYVRLFVEGWLRRWK